MKKAFWCIVVTVIIALVACSDDSEQHTNSSNMNEPFEANVEEGNNASNNMESKEATENTMNSDEQDGDEAKDIKDSDRKVIYTANLEVEVESFQKSYQTIESKAEKLEGYVVESNRHESEEDESINGQVTVRVPQEKFQDFITSVEEESHKVLDSSTSGEDVTEEYVDLESRLASKEKVEKRLKSFMDEADKTEDLLDISKDLEEIQTDIEDIKGQKEYLENKTDLATVTIHLQETDAGISSTGKDDLNTWEKTVQQFMKSINFLIMVFSSVFIFIAGNIPVFILIGIILLAVLYIIRKRKRADHKRE